MTTLTSEQQEAVDAAVATIGKNKMRMMCG